MAKQDEVNTYFKLAADQYVNMNLVFLLDKCPYSQVSATCVGIKSGHFIARTPLDELTRNPLIWGSEVSGYFAVRDIDLVNCHFTSRLVRLYNAPPNALFMIFPLPDHIDYNQRRYSRRVNLDDDQAVNFKTYHGYLSGGDFDNPPQFRWQPLWNHGCALGELSANGMRLEINENNPLYPRMFINDLVLLRGDFGRPGKSAPIYVLGNIVRKMHKPDTEDIVSIGCHFESWRKIEANAAWFRADYQEGVPLIAQWLSRAFRNLNN